MITCCDLRSRVPRSEEVLLTTGPPPPRKVSWEMDPVTDEHLLTWIAVTLDMPSLEARVEAEKDLLHRSLGLLTAGMMAQWSSESFSVQPKVLEE